MAEEETVEGGADGDEAAMVRHGIGEEIRDAAPIELPRVELG